MEKKSFQNLHFPPGSELKTLHNYEDLFLGFMG